MEEILICILIILAGLFSVAASYFINWDWYFNNYRARFLVKIIGRKGARIFYTVFGLFLIGMAVAILLGS
ncbi:immunity 17 family protein [Rivularia sp. UHCC 0363]|uniref:immunity 17 family protein n=1 Tax=Rivularia sp. UHCC 0363 TaxID=3110244 RepID=UPI002B21EC4E|nr:immunity 17 family protein [Rivularia sp. UHCC 0363]MEA5595079.1 immunity 17 family protein [Rivularia sp. UHCC 0363]